MRRLVAEAEARKVERNDAMAPRQPVGDRAPRHERFAEAVQEDERRITGAEPHGADPDVAGLEPFGLVQGGRPGPVADTDDDDHAEEGERNQKAARHRAGHRAIDTPPGIPKFVSLVSTSVAASSQSTPSPCASRPKMSHARPGFGDSKRSAEPRVKK